MTAVQDYSVLITDDDPVARETLRDIVEPAGYRTLLASSGEEAIDIVQRQPIHLALMDMHMPRLSGLDTIQMFYQLRGPLPSILISGDQDDSLLQRALSAHVFCVLAKPVNRHSVIYVVHRALEKFY